jgi:hypothetical protein
MPVWSFLTQVITPCLSSPITSQRQHSEVTQALHSIMLLNFWVAVELIRFPLKPMCVKHLEVLSNGLSIKY